MRLSISYPNFPFHTFVFLLFYSQTGFRQPVNQGLNQGLTCLQGGVF